MSALSPQDLAELERLAGVLQGGNYYELFGLKDGFTRDDLKKAYYTLSRRFHPDRFYRQDLGGLESKVEEVFAGINEGYRVLGDDTERLKYDRAQVGRRTRPSDVQAARANGTRPSSQTGQTRQSARPAESRGTSDPARAMPSPEPGRTTDRNASPPKPEPPRQEHVVSFTPRAAAEPPPPPPPAPAAEAPAQDKKRVVPPSVDRLKAPILDRLRKARMHHQEGVKHAADGNWPKAASAFYMAHTFDPKNAEFERLFKDADPKSRKMQAMVFIELARKAESFAGTREALINYQKAVDLDPPLGEPYFRLAKLLGDQGEPRVIMGHLRKAAEKEPQNVEYRLSLAKALEGANMKLNAHREFKAALELKPDNAEAKEGVKRTR